MLITLESIKTVKYCFLFGYFFTIHEFSAFV